MIYILFKITFYANSGAMEKVAWYFGGRQPDRMRASPQKRVSISQQNVCQTVSGN